jgi:ketosteroid isomerase-like protein
MRLISGLIVVLFCVSASAEQKTPEAQIAALEAELGQAMIHRDVNKLSDLVSDEWTIQQDSDQLGRKAGFIGDIQSGTLVVTSFKLHHLRIRMLGDVAVVQAFDDEVSSYAGKDGSGTFSWMDVWAKRNGHWVSIATQLTKVRSTPSEQAGIDAGNQAWIDGMKAGDVARIAATYEQDAVDCNAAGECLAGKAAIAERMGRELSTAGRAVTAKVKSMGSDRLGDFVYEWGQAEADFASGKKRVDRYLTAWHRQANGDWKIFRNLVIPER